MDREVGGGSKNRAVASSSIGPHTSSIRPCNWSPAPVKTVFCDVHYGSRWDIDIGNYANLLIKFENDVRYQIEVGNLAKVAKPRWYVLGDLGGLIKHGLDPQERPMVAGNIDAAEEDPDTYANIWTEADGEQRELVVESVRGSWKSYYQNISDVLNKGAELIVKPEEIKQVMQVYDAAMRSSETGEAVQVLRILDHFLNTFVHLLNTRAKDIPAKSNRYGIQQLAQDLLKLQVR